MADMNAFGRAVRSGTARYLEDKRAANRQKSALDQQLAFLRKQGQLQAEMKKEQDLYEMDRALKIFEGNPDQKAFATNAMYGTPLDYLKVQKPLSIAEQAQIDYQNKGLGLNEQGLRLQAEEQGYMKPYYQARSKLDLTQAAQENPTLDRQMKYLQLAKEGGGKVPVVTGTDLDGNPRVEYVDIPVQNFDDLLTQTGTQLGFKYPSQENELNKQVQQAASQIDFRPFYQVGQLAQKNDPNAVRTIQMIIAKAKMKDPNALAIYAELKRKGFLNRTQNAEVQ